MSGEEHDGSPGTEQPTHSEKGNPPESTGAAAIPFKRLGDFELLREIGRGGMGVVYEAQQVSLKRRVALKVLPPGLGLTDQAVQRFEREAQAAAKLHHTNIVPVYATGEDRGFHYYAMELVEGQSLSRVVDDLSGKRSNPLLEATVTRVVAGSPETRVEEPPAVTESTSLSDTDTGGRRWFDTVAKLMADVGDALQYAHDRGVIHRDVKPANLLLSGDGRLCLGDFGLARVAQEPGMTVSGSFLGTPAYMSPEQIAAGRIQIDHRTDVYSLGAVLYEMLTLQRPFLGDSRDQVLSAIMAKDPRPPRRLNPRVPVDLETICLKAIEKDPDRRYATAGEMAADLRQFLQRGLITARRAGPVRRIAKLVRRHPAISVGIGAGVALLLLAALAWQMARGRSTEAALRAVADARYFLSQGDYAKGLESTDEALSLAPSLPDARAMRARLLIKLRRHSEAVQQAREILAEHPDDWMGHLILAVIARSHEVPELSEEEHLQAVEALAPETAEVLYLRGMFADTADEAIELLSQALALDPTHAEALSERSRRYAEKKEFQTALKDAERLAAMRPRSAQGRRHIARIYRWLNDPHRALKECDAAVALDPADPITYQARANVYRWLGKYDDALRDLDRAIELDPEYAGYYHSRAIVHLWHLSDYEQAAADAERAIGLNPDTHAYETLSRAFLKMDMEEEAQATIQELLEISAGWKDKNRLYEVLLVAAILHQVQGDSEKAAAVAGEMIELDPDRHWGYVYRAWNLRKLDDRAGMQQDCDRIVKLSSKDPDDLLQIANALDWACDRPGLAAEAYSNVIGLAPNWADPYVNRAAALREEARCDEALADYDRAIELAPRSAFIGGRADLYAEMERFEEALQDFDRHFELGYEDRWARWGRAEALALVGRVDEALADLDEAIAQAPKDGWGYQRRAALLLRLGRAEEALAAANQAIEVEPTAAFGYLARVRLKLLLSMPCEEIMDDFRKWRDLVGESSSRIVSEPIAHLVYFHHYCPQEADYDAALRMARQMVELWPRDHGSWGSLGAALGRTGRWAEARDATQRALDLEWLPDPAALFGMAIVQWNLGERAEARAYYDRGVERMEATWPRRPHYVLVRNEAGRLLGVE